MAMERSRGDLMHLFLFSSVVTIATTYPSFQTAQVNFNGTSTCGNKFSLNSPPYTSTMWLAIPQSVGSVAVLQLSGGGTRQLLTVQRGGASLGGDTSQVAFDPASFFHLTLQSTSNTSSAHLRQNSTTIDLSTPYAGNNDLSIRTDSCGATTSLMIDFRVYDVILSSSTVDSFYDTVPPSSLSDPMFQNLLHYYPIKTFEIGNSSIFDSMSSQNFSLGWGHVVPTSNDGTSPFVPWRSIRLTGDSSSSIITPLLYTSSINDTGHYLTRSSDGNQSQLIPTRSACGQSNTILLDYSGYIMSATVQTSSSSNRVPLNSTTPNVIRQGGATITLQGSGIGLDGNLGPLEYVRLKYDNGTVYNAHCSVSNQIITCDVPPGNGTVSVTDVSLCQQTWTVQNNQPLQFATPNITTVVSVGNYRVNVVGQNLLSTDVSVSVNGSSWSISPSSRSDVLYLILNVNSQKRAVSSPLVAGQSYPLTITYFNQFVYSYSFNFSLDCSSSEGCSNGVCQTSSNVTSQDVLQPSDSSNFCNCDSTDWIGPNCNTSTSACSDCQAPRRCIRQIDNSLTCVDPSSGAGPSSNRTTAIVVGVVVGLLASGIIAGIIVFIVWRSRRSDRYGNAFIPLSNQNFDRIMYGCSHDQPTVRMETQHMNFERYLLGLNDFSPLFDSWGCVVAGSADAEQLVISLIMVMHESKKVPNMLEQASTYDSRQSDSKTLFRNNSICTKMFTAYSKLIGVGYMYETIGPEISNLVSDETAIEVDPDKMPEGADYDEARWFLMGHTQKILKSIFNRVDLFPRELAVFFDQVHSKVSVLFPGSERSASGGFVFSRYFCPAISTPETWGLLDDRPPDVTKRCLILITKVLQNLSNDVKFGDKETHMQKCNDFLVANREKLSNYYAKLLKRSTKPQEETVVRPDMRAKAIHNVYTIANKHRDKLQPQHPDMFP